MEATDKEGIRRMPTAIPDPPEVGEVEASLPWIAGIVARKATGRASAGRSAPSREEPRLDPDPESVAVAQRGRFRRSRRKLSLRDETRSKLGEAERPEIERGVVPRLRRIKPYDVA
jgi:hypothetical protein